MIAVLPQEPLSEEEQLLAGLRQADPAAANRLIDRFGQPLIRYFSVHLSDSSQAEDMAQEVFLRLVRTVRQGVQVRSLYSLVFTIARNLAIYFRRAAVRAPRWESLDEERVDEDGSFGGPFLVQIRSDAPDPREQAALSQQRQRLEAALRKLPPELRDVVILRHIKGLNGKQIASMLGVAQGTVWSRLARALEELRSQLGEPDEQQTPAPSPAERGEA